MIQEETNSLLAFIAAAYFNKSPEFTDLTAQAWHNYLRDFSLEQAKEGFDDWVRSGKEFPPSIAELFKLIMQNQDNKKYSKEIPCDSNYSSFENYKKYFIENGKVVTRTYQRATKRFKQEYLQSQNLKQESYGNLPNGEAGYILVKK